MTHQVFISFSSRDQKVAEMICTRVERAGIGCWVSYRDVQPGENYQEAIVAAIQGARVFVLVFSTNSNESQEVHKELSLASAFKAHVIPVRIANTHPKGALAYELATRQWIDAFIDLEAALEHLVRALGRAVDALRRPDGNSGQPAAVRAEPAEPDRQRPTASESTPLKERLAYDAPTIQGGLDVLAELQSFMPPEERVAYDAPTIQGGLDVLADLQSMTAPPAESQPPPVANRPTPSAYAFTKAELDAARLALAAHLGPIAEVLVRRAAAESKSLADLHARLGTHIKESAEQAVFRKRLSR